MINDNLAKNKSISFLLATQLLTFSDKMKGIIPEMLYVFDNKDLIQFFKIFGGQEIKIPSFQEFKMSLIAVEYFYYSYVEKKHDIDLLKHFRPISNKDFLNVKKLCSDWFDTLSEEDRNMYLNAKGLKDFVVGEPV